MTIQNDVKIMSLWSKQRLIGYWCVCVIIEMYKVGEEKGATKK